MGAQSKLKRGGWWVCSTGFICATLYQAQLFLDLFILIYYLINFISVIIIILLIKIVYRLGDSNHLTATHILKNTPFMLLSSKISLEMNFLLTNMNYHYYFFILQRKNYVMKNTGVSRIFTKSGVFIVVVVFH